MSGFWMPIATMVTTTDTIMETQAILISSIQRTLGFNLQNIER
jgi:putative heme iron utilization protein